MSYNPMRMKRVGRKNRTPQPNAGVRHSTIVARSGPRAISLIDMQNRKPSPHGWKVPQFIGDQFEVIYHYFCARNDTGELQHKDQDRCIRVLSGRLFITIGGRQPIEIQTGGMFTVEKGTSYRLSSGGTDDVELLFIQGPKYDETVDRVTQPGAQNIVQVSHQEEVPEKPARRTPSKAMDHAKKIATNQAKRQEAKRQPMKKREPLANSSAVMGSNPQPVGPGGYSE